MLRFFILFLVCFGLDAHLSHAKYDDNAIKKGFKNSKENDLLEYLDGKSIASKEDALDNLYVLVTGGPFGIGNEGPTESQIQVVDKVIAKTTDYLVENDLKMPKYEWWGEYNEEHRRAMIQRIQLTYNKIFYNTIKDQTSKKLPSYAEGLKKIDEYLYIGKKDDGLYFIMERIDDAVPNATKRQGFWKTYVSFENMAIKIYKTEEKTLDKKKTYPGLVRRGNDVGFHSGIDYFELSLEEYHTNNELWVAYASRKPIQSAGDIKEDDIEIVVSIMTDPDAPMVGHMGIGKSFQYMQQALYEWESPFKFFPLHNKVSVDLHSFAAKVMASRYDNKLYMMTAPTPLMAEVMIKALKKENVFVLDDEGKKVKKPPIKETDIFEYTIYDKYGDVIVFEENSVKKTIKLAGKTLKGNQTKRFDWWHHQGMVGNAIVVIDLETLASYMTLEPLKKGE